MSVNSPTHPPAHPPAIAPTGAPTGAPSEVADGAPVRRRVAGRLGPVRREVGVVLAGAGFVTTLLALPATIAAALALGPLTALAVLATGISALLLTRPVSAALHPAAPDLFYARGEALFGLLSPARHVPTTGAPVGPAVGSAVGSEETTEASGDELTGR